ncbi:MAG: serine/threonine protein kinase [Myxococcaceae bacterium]|nr:serine/threonine protein kinase [Myxococcaceae bacterium]
MTRASADSMTPARNEIVLAHDRIVTLGPEVGRGTAAGVYRGILEGPYRIRRAVACKVYDVVATDDRDAVITALARATRHAAFVQHPNVAGVYEFAVIRDAQPVVLSELVEGRPLTALIDAFAQKGRRLPLDLGLFLASEIAEGLLGAREARTFEGMRLNMSHHDLSAREVLISWRGEVKITDFGTGNAVRPASSIRTVRSLARRAATMPPEIARGRRGDARSDVFSLGILLREMLVGPRFAATTGDSAAFAYARDGHVEMSVLEPKLPEPVGSIVRRALEIDPVARYPHAGAMGYELRKACLSMGVGDGRLFLKHAMNDMLGAPKIGNRDEEMTSRHESDAPSRERLTDTSDSEPGASQPDSSDPDETAEMTAQDS